LVDHGWRIRYSGENAARVVTRVGIRPKRDTLKQALVQVKGAAKRVRIHPDNAPAVFQNALQAILHKFEPIIPRSRGNGNEAAERTVFGPKFEFLSHGSDQSRTCGHGLRRFANQNIERGCARFYRGKIPGIKCLELGAAHCKQGFLPFGFVVEVFGQFFKEFVHVNFLAPDLVSAQ